VSLPFRIQFQPSALSFSSNQDYAKLELASEVGMEQLLPFLPPNGR
jgi:hypothetical protein